MVVGNGMMAKAFDYLSDNQEIIIFASGVSDSSCNSSAEFQREKSLLLETIENNPEKKLVYFSSCDIANPTKNTKPYYQHKKGIEDFLHNKHSNFNIFRLPQVVGPGGNPKTLLNFIANRIKTNQEISVFKDTKKNILDQRDVVIMTNYLIQDNNYTNKTTNLLNNNYFSVLEIVNFFAESLDKNPIINLVDKSENFLYSQDIPATILEKLPLEFDQDYIKRLIQKYYS